MVQPDWQAGWTAWLGAILVVANPVMGHAVINVLSETTFLLFWTWGLWGAVRFLREGRFFWLPLTIGFVASGPVSGWLSDRYGSRLFAGTGLLLVAATFVGLLLIPVAVDYDTTAKRFRVTKILAFQVFPDSTEDSTYWGTLIDDYLVYGASVPLSIDQAPWCRDCGSVVVTRLSE